MSEEEQGRIALKLVKLRLMESGMPAPNNFRRELGNVAKKIGEEPEKLLELYAALLPDVIGVMLGAESVSLKTSRSKSFESKDFE